MTRLTPARSHAAAYLAGAALVVLAGAAHAAGAPLIAERGGLPSLAPLLKRVTPAVVNISVSSTAPAQQNPLLRDPFFRRFFNLPEASPQPQQAAGSGVIVDAAKGYVVTNHHVIENADKVVVTLKDGRQFDAKIVGSDTGTDIALLRIPAKGLVELPFGDSDKLEVGDFVIAIGNPFALGQTVTSGIVSALGRSGLNIEGYEDFIQTDASINPGNSGGALVDLAGRLVGINTAIIGPAGGNVGIGFAVPANMARAVVTQLIEYGEVRRGRLGVAIQDLTPDIARALGLAVRHGAVISKVDPGSPAARAGLHPGDVVVRVDGRPVRNSSDLRNRVGLVPIGEKVRLGVIREGKHMEVTAVVGKPKGRRLAGSDTLPQLQGAVLRNLQPGDHGYGQVEGVIIGDIQQGSAAWNHGLRAGDIILAVNRQRVRNVAEFSKLIAHVGRVVALNLLRGDTQLFMVIQ